VNFLAHFHLAWPDEMLVLGALEGDFHRGPLRGDLPPGLEAGIALHRSIDAFTDAHPAVLSLRAEFPSGLRRYAGILIDLAFDHMLHRHWDCFAPLPVKAFNDEVYRVLARGETLLSQKALGMSERLRDYDLLGRYADWRAVAGSAERIGERFSRGNPLKNIEAELSELRPSLHSTFLDFYPELVEFSTRERNRPAAS
jgi:acyl carrier protein phosphodiesterase